jgi:hypothetical protein
VEVRTTFYKHLELTENERVLLVKLVKAHLVEANANLRQVSKEGYHEASNELSRLESLHTRLKAL